MHKYKVNMDICTDYYNWVKKKKKREEGQDKRWHTWNENRPGSAYPAQTSPPGGRICGHGWWPTTCCRWSCTRCWGWGEGHTGALWSRSLAWRHRPLPLQTAQPPGTAACGSRRWLDACHPTPGATWQYSPELWFDTPAAAHGAESHEKGNCKGDDADGDEDADGSCQSKQRRISWKRNCNDNDDDDDGDDDGSCQSKQRRISWKRNCNDNDDDDDGDDDGSCQSKQRKTDLVPLIQPKLLCQADVSVGMDDGQRDVADNLVRKKDHNNGDGNDDDDDDDNVDSDDGRPPTAISM